jgi:hypothetical protein
LLFDNDCEALVYSNDGKALQGLTGRNGNEKHVDFPISSSAKAGEVFEFYVEVHMCVHFPDFPSFNSHSSKRAMIFLGLDQVME